MGFIIKYIKIGAWHVGCPMYRGRIFLYAFKRSGDIALKDLVLPYMP